MKQVILVRKDLNMSPGKAAAQCCHASLGAFMNTRDAHFREAMDWYKDGQTKIVVQVEDEPALLEIWNKIKADPELKGRSMLVRDAGHTELEGENLTTLGVGPVKEDHIDKYTRKLLLYK